MAGTLPPLFEITAEDHGGYAAVASYTLLALTLVIVTVRLFTRWFLSRVVHADDILLGAATILGFVQSIIVNYAISNGLGRKSTTIKHYQLQLFLKYEYAAQILLIVTVALSKLSLGLLFQSLMVSRRSLLASRVLIGVIVSWAVASIFALAFRCSMPTPWQWNLPNQCVNQTMLFQAIYALNIVTDVALVLLPCIMLRNVQLSRWKRFRIMALLASRILVCAATGLEIHYTTLMLASTDIPWLITNATIWDQVMMNLSIMTTAVPSLGRLVIELQPSVYAYTIKEETGDPRSPTDRFDFSSWDRSFNRDGLADDSVYPGTSVQVTSGWRETKDDGESTEGLVEETRKGVIQQTVHFEVH